MAKALSQFISGILSFALAIPSLFQLALALVLALTFLLLVLLATLLILLLCLLPPASCLPPSFLPSLPLPLFNSEEMIRYCPLLDILDIKTLIAGVHLG